MYENKKIALYIDVDNLGISATEYNNALTELKKRGEIVYGKVYGASERKHKEIIESINANGFDIATVMRVKKRGAKVFDNRIIVDVMESVLQNTTIDTVAIIACPTDLVWLYRKLHSYNIGIIALDNNDEENSDFVRDFIDIGIVDKLPSVKKPAATKSAPKKDDIFSGTAFRDYTSAPKPEVKPVDEVFTPASTPVVKPAPKSQPVKEIKPEPAVEKTAPVVEKPKPAPVSKTKEETQVSKEPEVQYNPSDELQVLKQIDDVNNAEKTTKNDKELLAEIRSLLEDFLDENN